MSVSHFLSSSNMIILAFSSSNPLDPDPIKGNAIDPKFCSDAIFFAIAKDSSIDFTDQGVPQSHL